MHVESLDELTMSYLVNDGNTHHIKLSESYEELDYDTFLQFHNRSWTRPNIATISSSDKNNGNISKIYHPTAK